MSPTFRPRSPRCTALLRAGGRLVVWDVDWATVSLHTTDPARTERILRAWDGHLAHPSLPQTLTAQLQAAGFDDVKLEGHTFATNEFDPDTYGGFLVPFIAQFVVGRDGISEDRSKRLGSRAAGVGAAQRVLLRLHPVLLHRDAPRLALVFSAQTAAPDLSAAKPS